MDVWFRHESGAIGLSEGIVRANDFAAFVSLQQAIAAAREHRLRLAEQAEQAAKQLLAVARQQAAELQAQAQAERDRGYQEGFESGRAKALERWAGGALNNEEARQRSLLRQRDRLGNIVALAVERVIDGEDREALYRRAVRTVSKLVRNVPMITMRVHTDDFEAARRALDEVAHERGSDVPIEIIADDRVAGGNCRFESDQGIVETGLPTQLAAIKRAVLQAARAALQTPEVVSIDPAPSLQSAAQQDDGDLVDAAQEDSTLDDAAEDYAAENEPTAADHSA
jgi:type III secretion protein L